MSLFKYLSTVLSFKRTLCDDVKVPWLGFQYLRLDRAAEMRNKKKKIVFDSLNEFFIYIR